MAQSGTKWHKVAQSVLPYHHPQAGLNLRRGGFPHQLAILFHRVSYWTKMDGRFQRAAGTANVAERGRRHWQEDRHPSDSAKALLAAADQAPSADPIEIFTRSDGLAVRSTAQAKVFCSAECARASMSGPGTCTSSRARSCSASTTQQVKRVTKVDSGETQ